MNCTENMGQFFPRVVFSNLPSHPFKVTCVVEWLEFQMDAHKIVWLSPSFLQVFILTHPSFSNAPSVTF
jgi:hypothetical protein